MVFINRKVIILELILCAFYTIIILCIVFDDTLGDEIEDILLLIISFIGGLVIRKMMLKRIKQKEQLEEINTKLKILDNQKNELLSFATHQLYSPLSALTGYSQMFYENSIDFVSLKQKEILSAMCESTHNLTIMLTDFLTISKIEQGGFKYEKNDFDLSLIVKDTVRQMKINADIKGLYINFKTNSDTFYLIKGDSGKIRHAIFAVLDNAIKYTLSGEINIEIGKYNNSNYFFIKISDTGIGIDKDDLEKIFNKFIRSNEAISIGNGSGLGLYLARKIIEAHNGRIEVFSEGSGRGSCFSIILPER